MWLRGDWTRMASRLQLGLPWVQVLVFSLSISCSEPQETAIRERAANCRPSTVPPSTGRRGLMQSDRLFVKCRPNFNVEDQIAHLAMISHCHCQIQKTRHLSDGRSSQKKKTRGSVRA